MYDQIIFPRTFSTSIEMPESGYNINRGQIRFLNSKTTDFDWYYSRHHQKLKFLICDLLFKPFEKDPGGSPSISSTHSSKSVTSIDLCSTL